MKTLKLSSIAMLLVIAFSSCTKDSLETLSSTSSTSSSTSSDYYAAAAAKGRPGSETDQATPIEDVNKKAIVTASVLEIKTSPSNVGSTIGINGTVTFSHDIHKANITVEKATTRDAAGKWNNWQAVEGFGGQLQLDKSATPQGSYSFANSFTAMEVGETGWRIHVNGAEAENTFSEESVLEIRDCVREFTVEPKVTAKPLQDGLYEFTVTYTLKSPVDMASVKFQGGATAGGQFEHKLVGEPIGLTVRKTNNQNTILTYEGALTACTPKVLSFTYVRRFSCPDMVGTTVTGDWTATVNDVTVKEVAPLVYNCSNN